MSSLDAIRCSLFSVMPSQLATALSFARRADMLHSSRDVMQRDHQFKAARSIYAGVLRMRRAVRLDETQGSEIDRGLSELALVIGSER